MSTPRAYVEHVAIWVKDIHWHIRFFHDVCGMTMREVQGTLEEPVQYWTLGGMQFMAKPDYAGPEGRLGHLIMRRDGVPGIAGRQPAGRRFRFGRLRRRPPVRAPFGPTTRPSEPHV